MVKISKIYFSLLIVFITESANGLRCNYCTSSNSIYNEDCHNGTNALPSGVCPFGFTLCFTRYAEDAAGNINILRDCSSRDGLASWNYPIEVTIYCDFDLCNVDYLGATASGPTTTESSSFSSIERTEPSTEPSSSATALQNMISIWILAFATAFHYI